MNIPSFSLPADDKKIYTEKDFSSGLFVLYLYPKDMTSGCTRESEDFRDAKKSFAKKNVAIFGLSKDSLTSHKKFREKYQLNFPLLSDEKSVLIDALGAWKEKSMYGKKYMGTERSTFVIHNGKIMKEWRKVKVPGHVQSVLEYIELL